ncbi:eCIS core domain-containing protein [Pseudoxanthomonas sp. 10H]|uniref:eCIS core domain-containing protein n=1 Tax=Pseudoxanthomonas sp. 10H TaxID=3242729 RepID=UPI0035582603
MSRTPIRIERSAATDAGGRASPYRSAAGSAPGPARMRVGEADGAGEREASRAADAVARGGEARVQPWPGAAPSNGAGAPATALSDTAAACVDAALATDGQRLDPASRGFMEGRFHRDFSQVRVHADATAVASAEALHAHAYATGNHIVFGRGAYAPHTAAGRHLLAHELAHVAQQPGTGAGLPLQRLLQRQPTSLAAIPEAERRAIHAGMTAVSVPTERITAFFTIMPSGRPSESRSIGATNSFDPAIPAAMHTGLGSIGAWIAGDTNALPLNSSIEVDLDLSAHGGARTTYRFTHFTHTTGSGRSASSASVMLVEPVGATLAAPAAQTVPASGTFAVGSASFTVGGNWNDADYTTLHQALGLLPAAALTAATGLTFRRVGAGTGAEGGHYDSGTDAVELNNRAFPASSDLRVGQRPLAVRNVLHEVGHAIDLRVLERAWQAYNSAGQTPAARRTLLAVRSPSGSRWGAATDGSGNDEIQENAGDTAPAFRAAVRRDGVRRDTSGARTTPEGTTATLSGGVTTYSDTDYQEMYAESFAMYVGARETLRQLRPATFAYFQSMFP